MVMVCYRFMQLSKLPNTICNRFRQPFMEMEEGCLDNSFIQPKQVTQHSMQPL